MSKKEHCRKDRCKPKRHIPEIETVKVVSHDKCGPCEHKITCLTSESPSKVDRTLIGTEAYVDRMWMAEANQELDVGKSSYTESYEDNEGKYPISQSKVVGAHKGFDHNELGELTTEGVNAGLDNYKKWVCGLVTTDIIKMATEVKGFNGTGVAQVGPVNGMSGNLFGPSNTSFPLLKHYREFSNEGSAEFAELYLRNLTLDIAFTDYAAKIIDEQSNLFLAKKILETPKMKEHFLQSPASGHIYTDKNIFRGNNSGADKGGHISQFLLANINAGAANGTPSSWTFVQKYNSPKPLNKTSSAVSWGFTSGQAASLLNGQSTEQYNGGGSTVITSSADTERTFIHSGRTMGAFVTDEPRSQATYNASLMLSNWGVQFNPGLVVYLNENGQQVIRDTNANRTAATGNIYAPFVGNMAHMNAYYWKYMVARRVRPEAMGLYLHNQMTCVKDYGFPSWFANLNGELALMWSAVKTDNKNIAERYGANILPTPPKLSPDPRTTPSYNYHTQNISGAPRHPCYPSGHSAAIGGGMTLLKFVYNCSVPLNSLAVFKLDANGLVNSRLADDADLDYGQIGGKLDTNKNRAIYLEANSAGTQLLVKFNDDSSWTVNNEIDKMISNIAHGRDWLGVHYRSDDTNTILYAEEVAIRCFKDLLTSWTNDSVVKVDGEYILEAPKVTIQKYQGQLVTVEPHFQ